MEIQTKRARRAPADWKRIIDDQKQSGLSQENYCRQHNVGYSSFHHWKAKLANANRSMPAGEANFIELPLLASASALGWDIELDLGYGIVLRMRRAS